MKNKFYLVTTSFHAREFLGICHRLVTAGGTYSEAVLDHPKCAFELSTPFLVCQCLCLIRRIDGNEFSSFCLSFRGLNQVLGRHQRLILL